MNRRSLLKGFVAGAAGLLVPTGVVDAAEEVGRRFWALGAINDATMRGLVYPDYLASSYLETERFDANMAWTIYIGQSYYPVNGVHVPIHAYSTEDAIAACGLREWPEGVPTLAHANARPEPI